MENIESGHNGVQEERLGRLLAMAAGLKPTGGPCPTPEQLAALTEGGLSGSERDLVLGHVAGCDACRDALALAVRLSGAGEEETARGWGFGRLVPYAAAAGLVLAAVSAALVYRGYIAPSGTQLAKQYAPATAKEGQPTEEAASLPAPPAKEKGPAAPAAPSVPIRLSDMPLANEADTSYGEAVQPEAAEPHSEPQQRQDFMAFAGPSPGAPEREEKVTRAAPPAPECSPASEGGGLCVLPDDKGEPSRAAGSPEPQRSIAAAPTAPPPPPAAGSPAGPRVVKARGTVVSLDLRKGEFVFRPAGGEEQVQISAEEPMLKALKAGDDVLVVYEEGGVNTATRIKKVKAVSTAVGC